MFSFNLFCVRPATLKTVEKVFPTSVNVWQSVGATPHPLLYCRYYFWSRQKSNKLICCDAEQWTTVPKKLPQGIILCPTCRGWPHLPQIAHQPPETKGKRLPSGLNSLDRLSKSYTRQALSQSERVSGYTLMGRQLKLDVSKQWLTQLYLMGVSQKIMFSF